MRITIFGPTGNTGRQLVSGALAAGHEVTAFTRHPGAIAPQPGLQTVSGSTRDAVEVERAIENRDAVLCALGGRPWRRSERVCSSAMKCIVPAMARQGVRRVVAISTFGAGDTRAQVGWVARSLACGLVLRSEVADKEAMESELAASDLDWVVVRVGLLTDGPASGTWRAADDGSIHGMGKISRADVAAFMLDQLANDTWVRRRPALMY